LAEVAEEGLTGFAGGFCLVWGRGEG